MFFLNTFFPFLSFVLWMFFSKNLVDSMVVRVEHFFSKLGFLLFLSLSLITNSPQTKQKSLFNIWVLPLIPTITYSHILPRSCHTIGTVPVLPCLLDLFLIKKKKFRCNALKGNRRKQPLSGDCLEIYKMVSFECPLLSFPAHSELDRCMLKQYSGRRVV